MARKTGGKGLSGLNPLAYLGVEAETPSQFISVTRAPTVNDYDGYNVGTVWLHQRTTGNNDMYMLISKDTSDPNGPAIWQMFGSGSGDIVSLTGNSGGAVTTDAAHNINVLGDNANNIDIVGVPATFTLTAALVGTTQHAVQVGNAAGSLTSLAVGATNQVLLGNTGADPNWGTVPNAALTNSTITLSNGNNITITGSPVALGGTATIAVSGTTDHAVQIGNGSGSLTSLTVGSNGQVLIGATGADPAFAAIASASGTVSFTTGANSLDLEVVMPNESAFSAYLSANALNVTGDGTEYTIICDTELFDTGADYNNATGVYTAPVNGIYHFEAGTQYVADVTGALECTIHIKKTSAPVQQFAAGNFPTSNRVANFYGDSTAIGMQAFANLSLVAGDTVTAIISGDLGALADDLLGGNAPIKTFFSGFLLRET